VSDTYARAQAKLRDAELAARDAADTARKASAYASLWLFISLLAGAFIALGAAFATTISAGAAGMLP
jgi:formate/nitrite transporter FocA (FNT family)